MCQQQQQQQQQQPHKYHKYHKYNILYPAFMEVSQGIKIIIVLSKQLENGKWFLHDIHFIFENNCLASHKD